jgi:molybdopterin-guanine dinucleotide biosynthesis protein A
MDCFILAGGQSRRFGEDKILFRIGPKRTVEYVMEVARRVCDRVFLVVKDRSRFGDLGVEVVEDLLPHRTPLAGILTALRVTEGREVLILGGDMPLMREGVLRLLLREYEEPVTVPTAGGRLQPLVGVYSKGLAGIVEDYMRRGGRSVLGFLESISYKTVPEERVKEVDPDLLSFTNLNTKEDLAEVMERLSWT